MNLVKKNYFVNKNLADADIVDYEKFTLQLSSMLSCTIRANLVMLLLVSCTDSNDFSDQFNRTDKPSSIKSLIEMQTNEANGLATFLDSGIPAQAVDITDGAIKTYSLSDVTSQITDSVNENNSTKDNRIDITENSTDLNADVSNFPSSPSPTLQHKQINHIKDRKDQTIASLTLLNEELIREVQRLRSELKRYVFEDDQFTDQSDTENNLYKLQSEIVSLKSKLIDKSHKIDGLSQKNKNFHNGIDSLKPVVNTNNIYSIPPASSYVRKMDPDQTQYSERESKISTNYDCTLEFDAVVTLLNGKSKEVFYTEFFLMPKDLPQLLFENGFTLIDYPQVSSFEELWAKSRKSPFVFPGIYKKIRNILLNQVEQGKGSRVRTDIDGFAGFNRLSPGKYYLLGTAPVGKTGAVWNVPVQLKLGSNKTSLTLANANWRE